MTRERRTKPPEAKDRNPAIHLIATLTSSTSGNSPTVGRFRCSREIRHAAHLPGSRHSHQRRPGFRETDPDLSQESDWLLDCTLCHQIENQDSFRQWHVMPAEDARRLAEPHAEIARREEIVPPHTLHDRRGPFPPHRSPFPAWRAQRRNPLRSGGHTTVAPGLAGTSPCPRPGRHIAMRSSRRHDAVAPLWPGGHTATRVTALRDSSSPYSAISSVSTRHDLSCPDTAPFPVRRSEGLTRTIVRLFVFDTLREHGKT